MSNIKELEVFKKNVLKNFGDRYYCEVGMMEFPSKNELSKYIDYIYITLNTITSTLISLQFNIKINTNFQEDINEIVKSDIGDLKRIVFRKDKNILNYKYWGEKVSQKMNIKKQRLIIS